MGKFSICLNRQGESERRSDKRPAVARASCKAVDALIDEACKLSPNARVRLLKIDAEGAEYPTLLTAQQLYLVDEICGESHNNVPWHDELPGIAGLTNRLQELGFVVTHVDNGPNTSIFWARRQPC